MLWCVINSFWGEKFGINYFLCLKGKKLDNSVTQLIYMPLLENAPGSPTEISVCLHEFEKISYFIDELMRRYRKIRLHGDQPGLTL